MIVEWGGVVIGCGGVFFFNSSYTYNLPASLLHSVY